jgi:hypothetical protein
LETGSSRSSTKISTPAPRSRAHALAGASGILHWFEAGRHIRKIVTPVGHRPDQRLGGCEIEHAVGRPLGRARELRGGAGVDATGVPRGWLGTAVRIG